MLDWIKYRGSCPIRTAFRKEAGGQTHIFSTKRRLKCHRISSEDYLEAMLMMREKHGFIRSIDVAEQLGVTKPSVSYATKRLRENGYITMDRDGLITLTKSGMAIADKIYTRHKLLTELFIDLGVNPETSRADACRIEHDLSEDTFRALCELAVRLNPDNKPESAG